MKRFRSYKRFRYYFLIYFIFFLPACQSNNNEMRLVRSSYDLLDGWNSCDHSLSFEAFEKSCKNILSRKYILYNGIKGSYYDWKEVCIKAERININNFSAKDFFENNFTPFKIYNGNDDKGLFTGYYEIELYGNLKKTKEFSYPVYLSPSNLQDLKGKLPRKNIDNGFLHGKNLEIAYVNDKILLFFLHIQGSGRIKLPDGNVLRLSYDEQNGHKYYPIGRYLIENENIDKIHVNAEFLIEWLRNNPDKAQDVMHMNESYVFFKVKNHDDVIGAQGVALTSSISLAVDNKYIPYGSLLWLNTTLPDKTSFKKLMVAQDTGGAIKGVIRGDIFFGYGKKAEKLAWHMKNEGSYHILLPNDVAFLYENVK